jgi:hypothetical protein
MRKTIPTVVEIRIEIEIERAGLLSPLRTSSGNGPLARQCPVPDSTTSALDTPRRILSRLGGRLKPPDIALRFIGG